MESEKTLQINDYLIDPAIPIVVQVNGMGADFPAHQHDFTEVVFIRRGRGTHWLGGEAVPAREGDVFVIPPHGTHAYTDSRDMAITNIIFSPSLDFPGETALRTMPGYHALFALEPHYRARHHLQSCLHLAPDARRQLERLTAEVKREVSGGAPGAGLMARAMLCELIVFLCREYDGRRNDPSRKVLRLAETVSWMEANAVRAISIDELCGMAHMARSTFHRVFEDVYGMPPMEYLIRLRVERAAALLQNEDASITTIALETGFSDGNYLARQFRRHLGMSPSAYRARLRSETARHGN